MVTKKESKEIQVMRAEFTAFLFVLWKHLGLPRPTRMQIAMAKTLQFCGFSRFILQGFRGIAKSYITCAFSVWLVWNDPQVKVLITSASGSKADENAKFIKQILGTVPFLAHLKSSPEQLNQSDKWDVGPAKPSPSPTFKSVGIFGQVTGSRADIIIADDVEIPANSATEHLRDKLLSTVQEFEALLTPKPTSRIIYLGTPQTEMTLYGRLCNDYGFNTIIFPVLYPRDAKERLFYGPRLAEILQKDLEDNPSLSGKPTDPERFDMETILERRAGYGETGFTLQFMLNPTLSDAERYPLRLRDLIIADLNPTTAPYVFTWMPNRLNKLTELPMVGLSGDAFHTYESIGNDQGSYTSKILVIDPSGRGKDESGWAVIYELAGNVFLMDAGGLKGGYKPENLEKLASIAAKWKVHDVIIEGNFGDGMYTSLFEPVLLRKHRCAINETKSTGQKEKRIADVLEPLFNTHRVIVNRSVFRKDFDEAIDDNGKQKLNYSLQYQISRLTRDRGALAHDDRLDAFAIGCSFLVERLNQDNLKEAAEANSEWLDKALKLSYVQAHDKYVIVDYDEDDLDGDFGVCSWV